MPFFFIKPLTMDDFRKAFVSLRTFSSDGPKTQLTASGACSSVFFL